MRGAPARKIGVKGSRLGAVPKLAMPAFSAPKHKAPKRTRDQLSDEKESRATGKMLTKEQKRELLYRLAHSPRALPSERIKAIEVDNRMAGHNEPEQHEVAISDVLLGIIRNGGGARA